MRRRFPDLSPILEALALDPLAQGAALVEARELATDSFPRLDTDRPAFVLRLDDAAERAGAARTLLVNYPADHGLRLVRPARGKRGARVTELTLAGLAGARVPRGSALYVPPLAHASSPLTLANIMARLRAPDGCPWDREQTHESITRALVEEAYEVIETISDRDMPHLMEELGDLWLHVLFQTQIARDEGEFGLADVGAELAAKLIRRHPHVFGDVRAADAAQVLANWEQIKQEEKKSKGQAEAVAALDAGIPRELPALTRAQKVQERVRRNGARQGVKAIGGGLPPGVARRWQRQSGAARERAIGALLLEIAGYAEAHGIDAERALRSATRALVEKQNVVP